jgi:hypothetical protein
MEDAKLQTALCKDRPRRPVSTLHGVIILSLMPKVSALCGWVPPADSPYVRETKLPAA